MTATAHELRVGDGPDAVPVARRFVTAALERADPSLRADAELVTTELVTNALLHGAPPVTLRVVDDGVIRIEVEDHERLPPVPIRAAPGGMTGRGLRLVGALSREWGSTPLPDGKVVWAELSTDGAAGGDAEFPVDVDALLAEWADDDDELTRYNVELGSVPTDLLIEAKAHIDNLVREFTLMSAAAGDGGSPLPSELLELVQTVVHGFADARTQVKQQAIAASARGDLETSLRLVLPVSAADAGERYLAALDAADRHARAARLLTLETPPAHRVFRHWYVQTLVDQLRRVAAGQPTAVAETFPQRLAAEVTRLAPLQQVANRLTLLQHVTAELTAAATVDEIVSVVCDSARDVLGAIAARIYRLEADGVLRSAATAGGDPSLARQYDDIQVGADLPGSVALQTGRPVVLRNLAEIAERFPVLAGAFTEERTLLVAPLAVGEHQLGVLSLTFAGQDVVDEQSQLAFLTTVADVTAQALERAEVAQREAEANVRLSFLAQASVVLASSVDYRSVLEAIAGLVVPRLADWCVIQLVEDGRLNTVALTHVDPAKVTWARQVSARYPDDPEDTTGAANVIRTGRSELYPTIPPELIEAAAVDADHLTLLREFGLASGLVVPLVGRTGIIGALTMIYAESGRHYDDDDVAFAEDLARRAALAVETAHAFHEQSGRLATVMRVAEAAQHAILSPPPARIGPVALAARYVSASAEALVGGDLYEVVPRPGAVRLLIGDVRGKGLDAVRLATVVLGEFRAAAADLDDLAAVARQIDRRLRPYLLDEDFVTALIAEIADDGSYLLASCGHPPALVVSRGAIRAVDAPHTLPLGLGADPEPVSGRLQPGDRLFLYTDGIMEARDAQRRFVDLMALATAVASGGLDEALDGVLLALTGTVGAALADDLALLVAQFADHADED